MGEFLECVTPWLSRIGLGLDLVGVVLVWSGVRISIAQAMALEALTIPNMIDDVGSEESIRAAAQVASARAAERMRASHRATIGLAALVIGFALQLLGTWAT